MITPLFAPYICRRHTRILALDLSYGKVLF